ncbi:endonuclease/exonuclease/phosphatase family protein [Terrabacter sp. NPDC000476]|uniref:endonuclease/exonuclease/phosphatase family protein n=1 Tax=Terrabacter sp. NPDC000476 TaxID=3154258 RepID=UPI0033282C3C
MTAARGRRVDVAVLVVLLALVAVGALRWLDTTAYAVVVLQTAGPFVVVGLLLLAVATAVLRRWRVLVPVVAALAVGGGLAVPTFLASSSPKADTDVTVMAANLWVGQANSTQLMDAVRYHAVDVLVLTEATPDAIRGIDDLGADSYFTTRSGVARAGTTTGTMVLSRFPLTVSNRGTDQSVEATASIQPEVVVTTPKGPVRLKVAHPTAPLSGETDAWRAGLAALTAWKSRQTGSEPIVVAGDLNASFGHPAFRSLADGLVDAQRADGQGWVRTWPFAGNRLPPFVQLDHVLSRGLTVVSAGQVAMNRADHAAVWAAYALPR